MLRNLRQQSRSLGEEHAPTPTVDAACAVHAERPVGVGASPYDRARRTLLKPADGSWEAFEQWLDDLGETVDDLDWLSELYLTTCERNGWPLPGAAPTLAPAVAIPETPPPALVEAPRAQPVPIVVRQTATVPAKAKLKPKQAAELFVQWVRDRDRCGTYSNSEMTELCKEFFEAEGLAPLNDNVLRPALLQLAGDVLKSRSDNRLRHGTERERQRHYKWTILEAETAAPWKPLPLREGSNRRAA